MVNAASRPPIEHALPWTAIARLERERELVGIYMSAHPLDPYFIELNYGVKCTVAQREELVPQDGMEITFGGLVLSNTAKTTRKGDPMQVIKIEDFTGTTEIILFGRSIYEYNHLCQPGTPVLVTGSYGKGRFGDEVRFRLDSVRLLDDIKGSLVDGITLKVADDMLTPEFGGIINDIIGRSSDNLGSLSFNIFSPRYNRKIVMRSAKKIPSPEPPCKHSTTTTSNTRCTAYTEQAINKQQHKNHIKPIWHIHSPTRTFTTSLLPANP